MKHIMEFNLPEERDELTLAEKGQALYSVCWGFYDHLRQTLKYSELTDKERKLYEIIRDKFCQELTENGIDLYGMVE